METVANQRVITTKKEPCSKKSTTQYYTAINLKALELAMKTLSPNAFKMWVYLGKNKDNYTFALSKVDTLKWCGFSKGTYSKAFEELEENGFLVKTKDGSNHYDFYELPKEKKEELPVITIHKATKEQPSENAFVF
jgi:hypothetical protein